MSPSSSALPLTSKSPRSQTHSRKSSSAAVPQQTAASTSRPATEPIIETNNEQKNKVHYTVFIRLPFPRNGFEDPPPVDWTAAKDRQLWKLISSASNSKDLDWAGMSERFEVPLSFLLQQAAWLYERHFEGMRAQMKRLGAEVGATAVSGTASPRAETQVRERGSGVAEEGKESKLPTSINIQRVLQAVGETGSLPATPRSSKPFLSRNPSTNTITQSRAQPSSPRQGSLRALRGSSGSQRRPPRPTLNIESSQEGEDESAVRHDGADVSQSESDVEPSTLARSSKVTRRPPLGKKPTFSGVGADSDGDVDEDDEESSGEGYLPFAAAASSKPLSRDDPAATLRGSPKRQTATPHMQAGSNKSKTVKPPPPESSESSASSAQPRTQSQDDLTDRNASKGTRAPRQRGPLSPKQRAQLAQLSPPYKSGSEASPSMGSSFSDLDELSVTQSALEEALMSNMQHGSIAMGSRMSSLRDALGRKQ